MQQRLHLRGDIEIATFLPEEHICRKQHSGPNAISEVAKLLRHQPEPCDNGRNGHHREQGRDDPADPANVKGRKGERAGKEIGQDDPRHEVAGEHEEHIDPYEAAAEERDIGVEEKDGKDSESPQSVEIGAIV